MKRKLFFPTACVLAAALAVTCFASPGLLPLAEPVSVHAAAEDGAVKIPSPDKTDRRVLWFQDFENKKTANWQVSENSPVLVNENGNTVYSVSQYDYVNFENVRKLADFRMEFNMKFSIPEENRGNAWPDIYIKSLRPEARYDIFFESKDGIEGATLRKNGKVVCEADYPVYSLNNKWFYVRIDVSREQISLYINDEKKPLFTYDEQSPNLPGPLGFSRGRTDCFYIDNLLITARPLAGGEEDDAFEGIQKPEPYSDTEYGKTYIDTSFSDGSLSGFTDVHKNTEIVNTENGTAARVTGELYADSMSRGGYSAETELALNKSGISCGSAPWFKFCIKDENNYCFFRTNETGSVIQVYKCVNGSTEWVGQKIFYLGNGRKLQLKIDVSGGEFRLYSKSKSYPNFEYPLLVLNDSAFEGGGIEFCRTNYLDSIDIYSIKVREITKLGNIGPRPAPQTLASVTENPYNSWTDVSGHWARQELKLMGNLGVMTGYADGTVRPDGLVTVKESIKMLCGVKNVTVTRDDTDWAKPYVDAAVARGWLSEGDFADYDAYIKRGELERLIKAAYEDGGIQVLQDGNRGENVTRAQAAAMLARLYSKVYIPCENTEFVSFSEYPLAFANPYKGFRNTPGEPYVTLVSHKIYWNVLENSESDGVEKIKEYAKTAFEGYAENNCKANVFLILHFPPQYFWPADMTNGDYTSEQFKSRLENMIKKLALAFDNDPRVAFIQMGIIGQWGEMQSPGPSEDVAAIMSEAFHKYFKNKQVLTNIVPHMTFFKEYEFGTHWDSFGHWDNLSLLDMFEDDYFKDIWKRVPTYGETAFDWGEQLGENPNDAVINYRDRYIELIRYTHCTSLSWIAKYDKNDPDTTAGAVEIQKAMGYRFVLQNARFTKSCTPGGQLDVSFTVANTGSAPIYYNEPLELSLLDPKTKEAVWKTRFDNTDIRTWQPEGDYSKTPVYTVSESFTLPDNLKDGSYTLALSILDSRGGGVPSIRFANTNYFKGGRHPIGNISVGNAEADGLDVSEFADLFTDRLFYIWED